MRCLFIIISVLLTVTCFSQHSVGYDSSSIKIRSFDKASIEAYKKDKQFQYDKIVEPAESLWDRFWRWFWYKIDQILSTRAGRTTFWGILILILVAAIAFVIFKMNKDRTGLFRSGEGKGLNYAIGEENIHDISFEDAIKQALDVENYRLAVRLVYLYSLKLLSDNTLIDWKPGKTNYAYVDELNNHSSHHTFKQLTKDFEYAWYGGESVGKEEYREFDASFNDFKIHLH